ncbi:hypothetical protein [Lonsdalea quercina]|uniref:hypothetical protein n=1 Tax=Lonsdalea quercina TaxID=71657 RepID=UPI00397708F9
MSIIANHSSDFWRFNTIIRGIHNAFELAHLRQITPGDSAIDVACQKTEILTILTFTGSPRPLTSMIQSGMLLFATKKTAFYFAWRTAQSRARLLSVSKKTSGSAVNPKPCHTDITT